MSLSEKEIRKILPLCIVGQSKAQQSLYEAFLPYIYTICKRYYIPASETQDVIQEIFSSMFCSLDGFKECSGTFKSWLRAIAIYKIVDFKRKIKPQHLELLDFGNSICTDSGILDNLYLEGLLDLINFMPDGYRTVVNMYLIEGFSHKEIAKFLNVTPETSRSQLLRAKKWLQKRLVDENSNPIQNKIKEVLIKSM